MSEITRRDILRTLALAIVSGAVVDRAAAQEVHQMVMGAQGGAAGPYTPVALTAHEYQTLERLTDLIIPVENGAPGAVQAGCAAWIDMLAGANDRLKTIYTTGIAWIDQAAAKQGAKDFVTASLEQQTALLDPIAYRRNQSDELAPGITFFTWARRMTVDGFYTSRIGMPDIYPGNRPQLTFSVPPEAIEYALKRSGL